MKSTGNERGGERGEAWLDIVQRQVASVRFGVVQIVIHESQVVQVEKTEKIRFQPRLRES
jgi:hypothetical protein